MKLARNFIAGVGLLTLSASLWACERPSTPEIPDPLTAVTPQMLKAKNDVKSFMDAANAYLECEKNTSKYNAMVDEMNNVADEFNASIRDFKQRMAAG